MAGYKSVLRVSFFAVVAGAIAFIALRSILSWSEERRLEGKILSTCRVTAAPEDRSFPPSLRVSFDNGSGVDLARTHFRLIFYQGELPLSRSDEDRTVKAAEKRDFVFLTEPLEAARTARPAPGTRLRYTLDVFPLSKEPLPTIRGEMVLEQP